MWLCRCGWSRKTEADGAAEDGGQEGQTQGSPEARTRCRGRCGYDELLAVWAEMERLLGRGSVRRVGDGETTMCLEDSGNSFVWVRRLWKVPAPDTVERKRHVTLAGLQKGGLLLEVGRGPLEKEGARAREPRVGGLLGLFPGNFQAL